MTVESGLTAHIDAHRFVAVHAQAVLRFAVEFDVALFAIVLVLGMALYQLARCQDGLYALGLCQGHQGQSGCDTANNPKQLPQS
jgi:hypothetical protein